MPVARGSDIRQGRSNVHWAERKQWLLSLGLTVEGISIYRLDNPSMSDLAWAAMVKEAIRGSSTLTREQRRRIRAKGKGTSQEAQVPVQGQVPQLR